MFNQNFWIASFCLILTGVLGEKPNKYLNITEFPGELCNRDCNANDQKVCYYKFVLENYQAMGVACGKCGQGVEKDCYHPQCIIGDGVEKGTMSINRMVPGPPIQVCQGDMIIVDVDNRILGSAASLHWHGQHMVEAPFMDGLPFVTQCPIVYSTTFRYTFVATETGTHFYHSHSGHHKLNGQYGALIVRQPDDCHTNSYEYDFDLAEHYVLISDWMHDYAEQHVPGIPSAHGIYPDAILINGRGSYISPETGEHKNVPATKYLIRPGRKYRFRVINSLSLNCVVQLQVQGHNFKVISSDSYNVEPFETDTLISNAGERYDFVLTANHTEGDFWIRVRGLGVCATYPTEAFALLRYESNDTERPQPDFPAYNDTWEIGNILNSPLANCFENENNSCVTQLRSLEEESQGLLYTEPEQTLMLFFHNEPIPNEKLFTTDTYMHFENPQSNNTAIGTVNNISLVFPSSPLLTQLDDIDESSLCDQHHWPSRCFGKQICECTYVEKIKLNSTVDIVLIDNTPGGDILSHPFHLHGYKFLVIEIGKRATDYFDPQNATKSYKNDRPPFKDTISIPKNGYAVLRFVADNPGNLSFVGFWLLHCHFEWHLATGMSVIFQVGEQDEMKKAPQDFPKCQNYVPKIKKND